MDSLTLRFGCIGTDSVIAGLNVVSKIARLNKEEING